MTTRITCPWCKRSVALTPTGRLYRHGHSRILGYQSRPCPGSHRTPEAINRFGFSGPQLDQLPADAAGVIQALDTAAPRTQ